MHSIIIITFLPIIVISTLAAGAPLPDPLEIRAPSVPSTDAATATTIVSEHAKKVRSIRDSVEPVGVAAKRETEIDVVAKRETELGDLLDQAGEAIECLFGKKSVSG